jgi:hypothetical protein
MSREADYRARAAHIDAMAETADVDMALILRQAAGYWRVMADAESTAETEGDAFDPAAYAKASPS